MPRRTARMRSSSWPLADVVFVVGSRNSSNSNRLREVAELRGVPAYLVDNADGIDPAWIEGKRRISVTAGASAPEVLVEAVIERLWAPRRRVGETARGCAGEDHLPAQGTAARATQSEGALARISHLGATAVIEMLAWRPSEAPASSS